jgi:tRNA pseudouridine38-40 synthase
LYNYKLIIEYDGKNYNGWQKQKSTKETIQEKIESSLEIVLRERIQISGSSRTDSGVHALNQTANFFYSKELDFNSFTHSINSVLPKDIAIRKISKVPLKFSSRYSAKKREYFYNVTRIKKPINREYFYRISYNLNFSIIDDLLIFFTGEKSYRSLCRNSEDKNDFLCNVICLKYNIKNNGSEIIFSVIANRFLHSMVRALIGCLLDAGRGKVNVNEIKTKFKKGEKIKTKYLPANALFLKKIYY